MWLHMHLLDFIFEEFLNIAIDALVLMKGAGEDEGGGMAGK